MSRQIYIVFEILEKWRTGMVGGNAFSYNDERQSGFLDYFCDHCDFFWYVIQGIKHICIVESYTSYSQQETLLSDQFWKALALVRTQWR